MSVSSLPEWKQLLLERKKREEEERERREKEEEEKLASIPAWKRVIIQRRRAKQEGLGERDRERERDGGLPSTDGSRDPSGDLDGSLPGRQASLGTGVTGPWLDRDARPPRCRLSAEAVTPVHRDPCVRSESARRRGRETERGRAGGPGHERGIEQGERERSARRDAGREGDRDREREKERPTGRKQDDGWERDSDSSGSLSGLPLVSGLRTIRADNVIIIEQERRGHVERRGRRREAEEEEEEGEREEEAGGEEEQERRGMTMDLRELLAGGGSVTEIRASEVLIIKPSAGPEEGEEPGRDRERDGEAKAARDRRRDGGERERPAREAAWAGSGGGKQKEDRKERPTAPREDRKWCSSGRPVVSERGARVSELLSRFGEHHRPPARSKSSENFARPGRDGVPGDGDDLSVDSGGRGEGRNAAFRGVPKRSFSFSDRVLCATENGAREDGRRQGWESAERTGGQRAGRPWNRLTDNGGRAAAAGPQRGEGAESGARGGGEEEEEAPEREEGFTVASVVRSTEGVSFARRVAIRQDGRAAERPREESERATAVGGAQAGPPGPESGAPDLRRGDGGECGGSSSTTPGETLRQGGAGPADAVDSRHRHASAFTECPSLLGATARRPAEPSRGAGDHGGGLASQERRSILSQHTEDLISKMRRAGETTNARGEGQRGAEAGREDARPEIRIPWTVFYGAEETADRKRLGGEAEAETRDGWRVGKPLSRVESLREKIREKIRERERERLRTAEGGAGGGDGGGGGADDGGTERGASDASGAAQRATEPTAQRLRKREGEENDEGGQEAPGARDCATALDVRQEADVSQAVPRLPVPALVSQDAEPESHSAESVEEEEEKEEEEERLRHEELRCGETVWNIREVDSSGEEGEEELSEEEEEKEEEEEGPSISPSDPLPLCPAAMSRIYSLKAACVSERPVDTPSRSKVQPRAGDAQEQGAPEGAELRLPRGGGESFQAVRRQLELLRLKGQEARWPPAASAPNAPRPRDGVRRSPRELLHQPGEDHSPTPWRKDYQTGPAPAPGVPQADRQPHSPRPQPKQQAPWGQSHQLRSVPVIPESLPSPENTRKHQDGGRCPPAPSCSPCSSPADSRSPSPSLSSSSSSVSPSPSPPPALFSIRSASGGRVGKRGNTITITPRKTAGEAAAGPTAAPGPFVAEPTAGTQGQPPTLTMATEGAKKRYPTAEEIVVIGGYQNLERSCLIKNRGTPKGVKVCFDEVQLERVCEYPSEISMLACPPDANDKGREEEAPEEKEEEEEEVERGVYVPKSTRSVGAATGRVLRVDESCPW